LQSLYADQESEIRTLHVVAEIKQKSEKVRMAALGVLSGNSVQKMRWWRLLVGLGVLSRVAAAAVEIQVPPTFNSRHESGLNALYVFKQSECASGNFSDAVSDDFLAGMSFDGNSFDVGEKCPSVQARGHTFEGARNGVRHYGLKGDLRDDATSSIGSVSSLVPSWAASQEASIEFWVVPQFNISDTFVLLEIGESQVSSGFTPGQSYPWTCTSRNFDFRLSYQNSNGMFVLEYRYGTSSSDCRTMSFQAGLLSSDSLHHIILTMSPTNESFGQFLNSLCKLYLDDTSPVLAEDLNIAFSTWNPNSFLRIGGSHETRSTSSSVRSWAGDILHFAVYDEELTSNQVGKNFDGKIVNNAPVPAKDAISFFGVEDSFAMIQDIGSQSFWDQDEEFGFSSTSSFAISSFNDGGRLGGTFRRTTNQQNLSVPSMSLTRTADAEFKTTDVDAYGSDGTTFGIVRMDSFSQSSDLQFDVKILPANDAPICEEVPNQTLFQGSFVSFALRISDVDCDRVSLNETFDNVDDEEFAEISCESFGTIAAVVISEGITLNSTRLYLPNEVTGECEVFNADTSSSLDIGQNISIVDGRGQVNLTLCLAACDGRVDSQIPCQEDFHDGIASEELRMYAVDSLGFVSNEAVVQVEVYGTNEPTVSPTFTPSLEPTLHPSGLRPGPGGEGEGDVPNPSNSARLLESSLSMSLSVIYVFAFG